MVFDLQQKSYHYVGRYDLVRLIYLKLKIYKFISIHCLQSESLTTYAEKRI